MPFTTMHIYNMRIMVTAAYMVYINYTSSLAKQQTPALSRYRFGRG